MRREILKEGRQRNGVMVRRGSIYWNAEPVPIVAFPRSLGDRGIMGIASDIRFEDGCWTAEIEFTSPEWGDYDFELSLDCDKVEGESLQDGRLMDVISARLRSVVIVFNGGFPKGDL